MVARRARVAHRAAQRSAHGVPVAGACVVSLLSISPVSGVMFLQYPHCQAIHVFNASTLLIVDVLALRRDFNATTR